MHEHSKETEMSFTVALQQLGQDSGITLTTTTAAVATITYTSTYNYNNKNNYDYSIY